MSSTKKSKADEAADEAAKRQAGITEADAAFREDVAKAADKRAKALAKLPGYSGNLAEEAWNETKAEGDPEYKDLATDFRQKLDTAVTAIEQTGNADIVGLEEFERVVVRLIAKRKDELVTKPTVDLEKRAAATEATDAAKETKGGNAKK